MNANGSPIFGFSVPPWWLNGPPPAPEPPQEEIPGRVRVAMALLDKCRDKTAAKPFYSGIDGVGASQLDGVELEPEERIAQRAACELLASYFSGKLKATRSEKQLALEARKLKRLLQCPLCVKRGRIVENCEVCGGNGSIVVEQQR